MIADHLGRVTYRVEVDEAARGEIFARADGMFRAALVLYRKRNGRARWREEIAFTTRDERVATEQPGAFVTRHRERLCLACGVPLGESMRKCCERCLP